MTDRERDRRHLVYTPDPSSGILAEQLRAAVDKLPPIARRLVLSHFWDDVPLSRLAVQFAIPARELRKKLNLTLRHLHGNGRWGRQESSKW